MHVLAIDPGNEESAWMIYDTTAGAPVKFDKEPNRILRSRIRSLSCEHPEGEARFPIAVTPDIQVVEMVASYGMAVGKEIFETVAWIGKFEEAWDGPHEDNESIRVFRKDVKMHLCGNNKAKDSNIRCALLDRYGPGKPKAVGTKKEPGPLYGIANDVWSALAIAVTWSDKFAANTLAFAG